MTAWIRNTLDAGKSERFSGAWPPGRKHRASLRTPGASQGQILAIVLLADLAEGGKGLQQFGDLFGGGAPEQAGDLLGAGGAGLAARSSRTDWNCSGRVLGEGRLAAAAGSGAAARVRRRAGRLNRPERSRQWSR